MGFRAWRNQSHSGINQESSSSDSACPNGYLQSGGDGERRGREGRGRICWPPLHSCSVQADGGVLRCRGSPLQRTMSAPGPQGVSAASAKTKSKNMPVVKTGFSSITITARRVPQTAGLPSREDLEPDPVTQATGPRPQDGSSVTLAGDLLSQSWSPTPQTSGHVIKAGGTCDQALGFTTQHRGTVAQAIGLVTQDGNPVTEASKMHPAVATGSTTMKPPQAVTDHVPVIRRRKPVIVKVTEYQQTYCPGERAAGTRPPEFRHSYSEGESKESTFSGKFQPQGRRDPTSGMFRSCAQMEIPAGSSNSVLYLDKCLSVSLEEPESRKEVHRSTLSLYLGGSSPTEDQRRREEADGPHLPLSCSSMFLDPDPILAGGTALVQKQCCQRLPLKPDPSCVSERPSGSKAHSHTYGSPPGDACRLATKAVRCGGKSDGQSSFGLEHPVCSKPQENVIQKSPEGILTQGPASVTADVKVQRQRNNTPKSTAAKHTKTPSDTVKARVEDVGNHLKNLRSEREVLRGPYCAGRPASEHGPSGPLRKASSWVAPFNESQDSTTKPLTLREALELFRPDFISRSQGRVRELEQRTQKRRAMQDSGLDLEPTRGRRRRNCTKPHPLSDNLFRPRERSISGKEMQRHSRRIYNKLPEVTRKKEEEKKKVLSQTNRLRAELFKKKLLDQILQRNTD